MRLREQANECGFHDNCDDRILEHLMQTIDNESLIRRCMTKGWTLTEFLSKAVQYEDIQLQIRSMKDTSSKLHKARQNIDGKRQRIQGIYTWPKCSYCGLSGIHLKGYNCPAFSKRCSRCNKLDHFARVCRATEYRNRALNWPELKQPIRQKHPSIDESTDLGSDSTETYYGQGMSKKVGHVRMKKVKKIKRKYCKVEKPDSTEQNQELRLIEQGEKSSKVCKSKLSREHERSKCICDRQFTQFRISDIYAQIEQLRNELKRWEEHCNFLGSLLKTVEVNSETKMAESNQEVVRGPRNAGET